MFPELVTFTIYGHTFAVYFYGAFLLLAIVLGVLVLYLELKRHKLETRRILDNVFWIILFGLIGARLGYALLHWSFFSGQPWEIIKFWEGGMVFSGGLVAGIVTAVVWLWTRERREMWGWLDAAMISVSFGHAVGMLGSFFSGLDIGKPTNLSWGVNFFIRNEEIVRHPTQIYECLAYLSVGVILFILSQWRLKGTRGVFTFSGAGFFLGVTLMASIRLLVEFVRVPTKVLFVLGDVDISSAYFSSLLLVICGIIGIGWRASKNRAGGSLYINKKDSKPMNEEKVAELKKKLENKKKVLQDQLAKIANKDKNLKDDYDAKFENFDSEVMDISNEATEVSNYQNKLSLEATLELQLRDVRKALDRMANGKYGQCEKCSKEIKPERLEALPHAGICLDCSNKGA
ncbi:MAG: prolipoprotein diacylglyceryl transferase [Parcubacteria group bacterium]|nr:prolipoprotein diacylglyceryl transferase [Parcubacteria group bacterium]